MPLKKMLATVLALALTWAAAGVRPGLVATADAAETPATLEIIVGELENTPRGLVLHAQDGDFRVRGLDMSSAAGRQVEVTGVVSEEEQPTPLLKAQRFRVLR